MNPNTVDAIKAILKSDQTVSVQDIARILDVCRNPQIASEPIPGNTRCANQFLTPKQAAQMLNTSIRTVWRLANTGRLRRIKIGSKATRFRQAEVENISSIEE